MLIHLVFVFQGILLWPLGGLAFIGHNAGPKGDLYSSLATHEGSYTLLIYQ